MAARLFSYYQDLADHAHLALASFTHDDTMAMIRQNEERISALNTAMDRCIASQQLSDIGISTAAMFATDPSAIPAHTTHFSDHKHTLQTIISRLV